jgi:chromosome segregation ATPase
MESVQNTTGKVSDSEESGGKSRSWIVWLVIIGLLAFLGLTFKKVETLTLETQHLHGENTALEGTVDGLTTDLEGETDRAVKAETSVASLTVKLNETAEQLKASQAESTELSTELAAANDKAVGLEGDLEDAAKRESGLKNNVAALEGQRDGLQREVASLFSRVKDQTSSISALKGTVDSLNGEIDKLNTDNKGLADAAARGDELAKTVEALKAAAEEQSMKISELEEAKTMLMSTRKKLADEVNELAARLRALLDENEVKQETIRRLQEEQAALVQGRDSLARRVSELESQIEKTASSDVDSLQKDNQIEELTTEREALELERDVLTTAYNDLAGKVETLTSQFQTLHSDFGAGFINSAVPADESSEFSTILP